jgi:hypothetical protein
VTSECDELCSNELACAINGHQGRGMMNSKNNRISKARVLLTGSDTALNCNDSQVYHTELQKVEPATFYQRIFIKS